MFFQIWNPSTGCGEQAIWMFVWKPHQIAGRFSPWPLHVAPRRSLVFTMLLRKSSKSMLGTRIDMMDPCGNAVGKLDSKSVVGSTCSHHGFRLVFWYVVWLDNSCVYSKTQPRLPSQSWGTRLRPSHTRQMPATVSPQSHHATAPTPKYFHI